MKGLVLTSSFRITLPDDIREEIDGAVSSFWLDNNPLLLQVSSNVRQSGPQVGALARLKDRMAAHPKRCWQVWNQPAHSRKGVDQATAEHTASDGALWVHTYLVWPHVAVYVTLCGPATLVRNKENWALCAIRSIRPTLH